MRINEYIEVQANLEIDVFERGKRKHWHQATKNIVLNLGRQLIAETITAESFGPGTAFTPTRTACARYVGFGIGGSRQTDPAALISPLADTWPAGYGGSNDNVDTDRAVRGLERPVQVTAAPLWMREIAAPGTFPTATSTRFIASFVAADFNFGSAPGAPAIPLSEIALYSTGADPALPNGVSGAYPGIGLHTMAYDTFVPFNITALFAMEVRWEFRL